MKTITLTAGDEITLQRSAHSPVVFAAIDGLCFVLTAPQARAVSEELRRLADEIEGPPGDAEKEAEAYVTREAYLRAGSHVEAVWTFAKNAFLAGWKAGRK